MESESRLVVLDWDWESKVKFCSNPAASKAWVKENKNETDSNYQNPKSDLKASKQEKDTSIIDWKLNE